MHLFVALAEHGSMARAAVAFGLSVSGASKELHKLETALGAVLIRRSGPGLTLTEAGRIYRDAIRDLVESLEETESRIGQGKVAPSGVLRVAIDPGFGRRHVIPHLEAFLALYPDVVVDLEVADGSVNLVTEGIDLAIRVGPLADSSMVARRIGSVRQVTVGTPAFLARHGIPDTPTDCLRVPCVTTVSPTGIDAWPFQEGGRAFAVEPSSRIACNDADFMRMVVAQGLGLGNGPRWLFAEDVMAGRLVEVLEAFAPAPLAISVLKPARQRQALKAEVFTDFLAVRFRET